MFGFVVLMASPAPMRHDHPRPDDSCGIGRELGGESREPEERTHAETKDIFMVSTAKTSIFLKLGIQRERLTKRIENIIPIRTPQVYILY